MGDIFRPRALESTTKTPLRATTMMKSAMAASETNNFSPVSFPFVALSMDILRVPARAGFQNGDGGANFSPADGREIFFLVRGRAHGIQDGSRQNHG